MRRFGPFALLFLMGMVFIVAGSRLSSNESANAMDMLVPSSWGSPSFNLSIDQTTIGVLEWAIPDEVLIPDAGAVHDDSKRSEFLRDDSESNPQWMGSDHRASDVLSGDKRGFEETGLDEAPERLLIPILRVNAQVVFVPFSEKTWDISDLGQDIAWLGSPTGKMNQNNMVLAGHVTLYDGRNGPLYSAVRLKPGDMAYVYSATKAYTYLLQSVSTVYPQDISILEDTASPQLTLITCTTWDEESSSYLRRLVFKFHLIKVAPRPVRFSQ